MRFNKIKNMEKPLSTPPEKNKKSFALACLGLSLIFMTAVVMSGCVVHHKGHGYSNGHSRGHGHGHHKGKVKIKPRVGLSVSPLIVIDD